MTRDAELVYSSDSAQNKTCGKCKKLKAECTCSASSKTSGNSGGGMPVLRIEKSGRRGKTVTVIDRLPKSDAFLKDLTRELKTQCGTGGTYVINEKHGTIEIQGEKLEAIRKILTAKGIKFKG